jgi:ATP-binding cassette, subfamily G (WHITE), member 2, PDR
MGLTVLIDLVNQIMPNFVNYRALYEAPERPSKIYSWKAYRRVRVPFRSAMNVINDVGS